MDQKIKDVISTIAKNEKHRIFFESEIAVELYLRLNDGNIRIFYEYPIQLKIPYKITSKIYKELDINPTIKNLYSVKPNGYYHRLLELDKNWESELMLDGIKKLEGIKKYVDLAILNTEHIITSIIEIKFEPSRKRVLSNDRQDENMDIRLGYSLPKNSKITILDDLKFLTRSVLEEKTASGYFIFIDEGNHFNTLNFEDEIINARISEKVKYQFIINENLGNSNVTILKFQKKCS